MELTVKEKIHIILCRCNQPNWSLLRSYILYWAAAYFREITEREAWRRIQEMQFTSRCRWIGLLIPNKMIKKKIQILKFHQGSISKKVYICNRDLQMWCWRFIWSFCEIFQSSMGIKNKTHQCHNWWVIQYSLIERRLGKDGEIYWTSKNELLVYLSQIIFGNGGCDENSIRAHNLEFKSD